MAWLRFAVLVLLPVFKPENALIAIGDKNLLGPLRRPLLFRKVSQALQKR